MIVKSAGYSCAVLALIQNPSPGGAGLDHLFKAAKHYTGHVVSILGWGTHKIVPHVVKW